MIHTYIRLKVLLIAGLLGMVFSSAVAQSKLPVFAFDSYGKWGYCYRGTDFVLPCYDNVVDLGPNIAAFWAQKDGKWGLRRLDNSEITPFVFEDVCVAAEFQRDNSTRHLDSITMWDRGVILPSITYDRHPNYISPKNIGLLFPLLPVKKEGKWGYVDFRGEVIIPFEYDKAFIFTRWLSGDKKRTNWLALVMKEGKNAWIDIFGDIIVPWRVFNYLTSKEKKSYLPKRKKEETQRYDAQINTLAHRLDSALVVRSYVNQSDREIKIVEVKRKKAKANVKPRYRILYADNTPVVPDTVDFVFEREGDALRVKVGDKMRVINLNTGWLPFAPNDSIAPFDNKGQALAWTGKAEYRIGLNGIWAYRNHSYCTHLSEIQSFIEQQKWDEAAKVVDKMSVVMPYYGSQWYRIACDATIRRVANVYNYCYDPKLIAQRAQKEAEEKAQKSQSGWAILGDILSTAGSFSDSSTSQSLKALGETIKTVADPNASTSETADNQTSYSENTTKTNDVATLQAQIKSIDYELKELSERQVQLLQERKQAKRSVVSAGGLAVKRSTGSDITRNATPSRVRQKAQQAAKAQIPARNNLSSIDGLMNKLNNRKAALMAQRAELSKQIKLLTESSDEETERHASSSRKSTEKKQGVNTGIWNASVKHINSIGRQLSDLHKKHEDRTQVFTPSDRSRVKSLQEEARRVRKECLEKTGETLPANSLESWNP